MPSFFESDLAFYYAIGVFVIAIFVGGVSALAVLTPTGIDRRSLIPLTVGFFLFMLVYFVSISIKQIEAFEDV